MRINSERLMKDIDALSKIGHTSDGGVSRVAMSENDVLGRAWFRQQVEADDLEFHADGAGNLSAILAVGAQETILIGSHLDTVPNGGRFDGALGVLSALEVLRTLKETGFRLAFNVEAISFTDEEGGVFNMLGSRALCGVLTATELAGVANPPQFEAGLKRLDITPQSILGAARDDIRAFVEVHIEQGSRLEEQNLAIGIVPSIVGIRKFQLDFLGEAAHAGTTPMDKRRDALWGAMDFIRQGRRLVMDRFAPGVMTVGELHIPSAASNIVPGHVTISLEFRHGTVAQLDAMEAALLRLAKVSATQYQLDLSTSRIYQIAPAAMSDLVMSALKSAAVDLGLSHTTLLSFAGHDTQTMAKRVPSGMFFVPSVDGISHNPREFTRPSDIENAANVLLHAVLRLAEGMSNERTLG